MLYLEGYCVGPIVFGLVIIVLIYVNDIFLLEKISYYPWKLLRILQEFYSKMGMIVNNDRAKIMIIECKNITHNIYFYANNLEEVSACKYLRIDNHYKLN